MAEKYVKQSNLVVVRDWIKSKLNQKQNKLTAGENITITGDVISASGGGGGDVTKAYVDEQDNKLKQDITNKQDVISDLSAIRAGAEKGATAVQTESDPTVPAWAKQPNKPTYTADEVGAEPHQ